MRLKNYIGNLVLQVAELAFQSNIVRRNMCGRTSLCDADVFHLKTCCALHFAIHAIPNFSAQYGDGTNFRLIDAANPVSLRIKNIAYLTSK